MQTSTSAQHEVAKAVSGALNDAGIVQREAAARTGIPLATLSRRLTGHSPFNVAELDLIAQMLGVTVLDLIAQSRAA